MPAYLTHRAAGEKVLRKLGIGEIPHNRAFYFGCQGPDILYFSRGVFSDGLCLGLKMHKKKTRELIYHALNYIKVYQNADKDELISYMAGFLTHYAIDKNSHPFIYDKSGMNVGLHHAMEYTWDYYSSKEAWDMEPRQFDILADIKYGKISKGISEWYVSAAKDVYGRTLKEDAAYQSLCIFAKSKKRIYTNLPLAGRIFLRVTSGLKTKELLHTGYRSENLFSDFERAKMKRTIVNGVNDACDLISFMLKYINGTGIQFPERIVNCDFLGNLLPAAEENLCTNEEPILLDYITRN